MRDPARLGAVHRDPEPWLGCGPIDAARRYWTGAFTFRRARASRAEFWWARAVDLLVVWLVVTFVPMATGIPDADDSMTDFQNTPGFLGIGQAVLSLNGSPDGWHVVAQGPPSQWVLFVWWVLTAIPNLALGARRLRDIGSPAWIALFGGVPIMDLFLLLGALRRSWRPTLPSDPDPDPSRADVPVAHRAA